MAPTAVALLNLIGSLDSDVEAGHYDPPRVVFLASKMSSPDLAGMALYSQQATVIQAALNELAHRGLDADGMPLDDPPDTNEEQPTESDQDYASLVF